MEQNRPHRKKLYFLVFAGALGIVATVIGGFQIIQFMDSTDFCGRLCHQVMDPEYTAYQASPHSRVQCVDCHVGYSASWMVRSKLRGIPQMFATVFKTYPRPIPGPVDNLRPARDTCEECHRPEKFSGDLIRVVQHYSPDENNSEQVITRALRVGGGNVAAARGIHWHIAAKVWYLPLDRERQEIGWVGVEEANGKIAEFIDPTNAESITPELINDEKRLMDCIDCHNRATHIFYSTTQLIDAAIAEGRIDQTLPFIVREGLAALDPPNSSLDEAYSKVQAIEEFYRNTYPLVYDEKRASIDKAISQLKDIARLTTFAHMKVTWETYTNNIGHIQWPGCFRCHGKLEATSGEQENKLIDAECNSCHYPLSLP